MRADVLAEDCVARACCVHLYLVLTKLLAGVFFGIESECTRVRHQNHQTGYGKGLDDWLQGGNSHRLRRCERPYNHDAHEFIVGRLFRAAIVIDILEVLGIA